MLLSEKMKITVDDLFYPSEHSGLVAICSGCLCAKTNNSPFICSSGSVMNEFVIILLTETSLEVKTAIKNAFVVINSFFINMFDYLAFVI